MSTRYQHLNVVFATCPCILTCRQIDLDDEYMFYKRYKCGIFNDMPDLFEFLLVISEPKFIFVLNLASSFGSSTHFNDIRKTDY